MTISMQLSKVNMLKINKNKFTKEPPTNQISKGARPNSIETLPQEIPNPWIIEIGMKCQGTNCIILNIILSTSGHSWRQSTYVN